MFRSDGDNILGIAKVSQPATPQSKSPASQAGLGKLPVGTAHPSKTAKGGMLPILQARLFDFNFPEGADHVIARPSSKEQCVRWTIGSRSASEINGP